MNRCIFRIHCLFVSWASALQISAFLFFLFSCWSVTTTGFLLSPDATIGSRSPSPEPFQTSTRLYAKNKPCQQEISSSSELESCWNEAKNEAPFLSARGDTQIIGSPDHPDVLHPVIRVLHDRKRNREAETDGSLPEKDASDKKKIALIIEGGGMRGCVTAGMVCAIDYLGLRDSFDVVYGSSAGSVIGAYFVTGQLPWFGPEVYYDQLPTAGKSFVDTGRLLRALGIGLLNPKLIKDVFLRRNNGKPVLELDFLLKETMQHTKPLDWETFVEKQQKQPLKILTSALKQEKPLLLSFKEEHFESIEDLAKCMHASSLLPGIAGPMVNLHKGTATNEKPKFVFANNCKDEDYEPLADALFYAPIPYDAAKAEGATHMVVLRSKPDGKDVIGKGGSLGEKLLFSRFLLRKNKLPRIYQRMKNQLHKRLYARNVLELNEAAKGASSKLPPTLTVAIPGSIEEVPRLETGRKAIFEGVRDGFARAYDALVEDPSERGKGYEVARRYFPDEILDYEPQEMLALQAAQPSAKKQSPESAFETYLKHSGVWPKAWEGLRDPPVGHSSGGTRAAKKSCKDVVTGGFPVG